MIEMKWYQLIIINIIEAIQDVLMLSPLRGAGQGSLTLVFERSLRYISPFTNFISSTPSLSYTLGCEDPVPTMNLSPEGE